MNFVDILEAARDHISDQVPGLTGHVHYPAPKSISKSPMAVLMWPDEEMTITHFTAGGQDWDGTFLVRIVAEHLGDGPTEMAAIDALVTPVVDAFTVGYGFGNVNEIFAGLPGHVRMIQANRVKSQGTCLIAGKNCYGTDISVRIQFRRKPGD